MHDRLPATVEGELARWRAELATRLDADTVLELESHARDALDAARRSGRDPETAWPTIRDGLGTAESLAREFAKLPRAGVVERRLVRVIAVAGGALAIALAVTGFGRALRHAGDGWLATHVFSISLGYGVGLTLGAVGVALSLVRLRSAVAGGSTGCDGLSAGAPALRTALARGTWIVSAACVLGIALGAVWAADALGRPWAWHPREVGAALVLLYHAGLAIALGRGRARVESEVGLAALGGAVTLAAWFGPEVWTPEGLGAGSWVLAAATLACVGLGAFAGISRPIRQVD